MKQQEKQLTLLELVDDFKVKRQKALIAYGRKMESNSKHDEYIQALAALHKVAVALGDAVVKAQKDAR